MSDFYSLKEKCRGKTDGDACYNSRQEQKGQIIESLKSDIALDSAAVILNDLNAYRKILSPIKK